MVFDSRLRICQPFGAEQTRCGLVDPARGVVAGHRRYSPGIAADSRNRPSCFDAALRSDAHRSGFIAPGGAVDARGGVAGVLDSCAAGCESRSDDGNQTLLWEVSRDMWSFRSLETLARDLRYGLRMMVRNPGFTAVAVLTLTLGIGACTAVFSVVYAVMLRPLPYHDPDRLCAIWKSVPKKGLERDW